MSGAAIEPVRAYGNDADLGQQISHVKTDAACPGGSDSVAAGWLGRRSEWVGLQ